MTCLVLTLVLNGVLVSRTISIAQHGKLTVHPEVVFFQGLVCSLSSSTKSIDLPLGLITFNIDSKLPADSSNSIPLLVGEVASFAIEWF